MNQLSEKQLSFDCAMKIVNKQKWIQIKDIEKLSDFIQEQQATINKLNDELELTANTKLYSRRELERKVDEQQDQISYWKHKVNSLLWILGQFDEEKVKKLLKEIEDE